jgi:hypothetical protein
VNRDEKKKEREAASHDSGEARVVRSFEPLMRR